MVLNISVFFLVEIKSPSSRSRFYVFVIQGQEMRLRVRVVWLFRATAWGRQRGWVGTQLHRSLTALTSGEHVIDFCRIPNRFK